MFADLIDTDNPEILYEENFSCPQYYQRLVIGSDGNAIMCSNDDEGEIIIGDAYSKTIHELWHSEKMTELRELHDKVDGFKELHPCRQCYYPRQTIVNQISAINGAFPAKSPRMRNKHQSAI